MGDFERIDLKSVQYLETYSGKLMVSSISVWEASIKVKLGKLDIDVKKSVELTEKSGLRLCDFDVESAMATLELPRYHGDPFDRALIAQARAHSWKLMTHDKAIHAYENEVDLLHA